MLTKEAAVQKAYQAGVQKALVDAGLVKEARMPWSEEPGSAWWPGLFGPIGGALAAPQGERGEGFVGTLAGSTLGGVGGAVGGGVLGALLGHNPEAARRLAILGLLGGSAGGGAYGYKKALE